MRQNIPVSFEALRSNYPARRPYTAAEAAELVKAGKKVTPFSGKLLDPVLQQFMDGYPGTPCCVQMTHAFNKAGFRVPKTYAKARRSSPTLESYGFNYILAVDEIENWLTDAFGPGELISEGRSVVQIKAYLQQRQGVLVLRDATPGIHTELWDRTRMVQPDMATDALLGNPRVLFWDCGFTPAEWLTDYMKTQ